MRLFTAVELDAGTLQDASAFIDELRRRVQAQAPHARLTWVPVDRLHLTVRFIGDVHGALADRILGALREPLALDPFAFAFEGPGAFPASGPPRVLWIGVGAGVEALIQAEAAVSDRLVAIGVAREDRAYVPHLTFARVRDAAGLRARKLFEGVSPRLAPTQVGAITLFRSRLSPKGPDYTVLQRTALRPSGAGARET